MPLPGVLGGPWRALVVNCRDAVPHGAAPPVFGGRARSSRAPLNDPCVWGNYAYTGLVRSASDRDAAISAFRASLQSTPETVLRARRELKGKRLACYCAPLNCHLHVLAEAANCSLAQLAAWFPRAAALLEPKRQPRAASLSPPPAARRPCRRNAAANATATKAFMASIALAPAASAPSPWSAPARAHPCPAPLTLAMAPPAFLSLARLRAGELPDLSLPLDVVVCESSGRTRDAIDATEGRLGTALSIDIDASEAPGLHFQGDARHVLYRRKWRRVFIFAPCEHLASSGSQYHAPKAAAGLVMAALAFFLWCWCAPADAVCAENSVGLLSRLWRPPSQVIHPYWFGPGDTGLAESKATCIWLRGFGDVSIAPTDLLPPPYFGVAHSVRVPGDPKRRRRERSRSHCGLVRALVSQLPPAIIRPSPRPFYPALLAAAASVLVARFGESARPPTWDHPLARVLPDSSPSYVEPGWEAWAHAQFTPRLRVRFPPPQSGSAPCCLAASLGEAPAPSASAAARRGCDTDSRPSIAAIQRDQPAPSSLEAGGATPAAAVQRALGALTAESRSRDMPIAPLALPSSLRVPAAATAIVLLPPDPLHAPAPVLSLADLGASYFTAHVPVCLGASTEVLLPRTPRHVFGVWAGVDGCSRDAAVDAVEEWMPSLLTCGAALHSFLAGEIQLGAATLRLVITPVVASLHPLCPRAAAAIAPPATPAWVTPGAVADPLGALVACCAAHRAESFVRARAPVPLALQLGRGGDRVVAGGALPVSAADVSAKLVQCERVADAIRAALRRAAECHPSASFRSFTRLCAERVLPLPLADLPDALRSRAILYDDPDLAMRIASQSQS